MDRFLEHVQLMHADRDKLFEQEYNVSIRECDSTLYVGLTRKQNGRPID